MQMIDHRSPDRATKSSPKIVFLLPEILMFNRITSELKLSPLWMELAASVNFSSNLNNYRILGVFAKIFGKQCVYVCLFCFVLLAALFYVNYYYTLKAPTTYCQLTHAPVVTKGTTRRLLGWHSVSWIQNAWAKAACIGFSSILPPRLSITAHQDKRRDSERNSTKIKKSQQEQTP